MKKTRMFALGYPNANIRVFFLSDPFATPKNKCPRIRRVEARHEHGADELPDIDSCVPAPVAQHDNITACTVQQYKNMQNLKQRGPLCGTLRGESVRGREIQSNGKRVQWHRTISLKISLLKYYL